MNKHLLAIASTLFLSLSANAAPPIAGQPLTYNTPVGVYVSTLAPTINGSTWSNSNASSAGSFLQVKTYNPTSADANGTGSNTGTITTINFQDYKRSSPTDINGVALNCGGCKIMSLADANQFVADSRSLLSSAATSVISQVVSGTNYLANEIGQYNAQNYTHSTQANAVVTGAAGATEANKIIADIALWQTQISNANAILGTIGGIGFGSSTATGGRNWWAYNGNNPYYIDGGVSAGAIDYSVVHRPIYTHTDGKIINGFTNTTTANGFTSPTSTTGIDWNDLAD